MAVSGTGIPIVGLVAGEAITESHLLVQPQSGADNTCYIADGASGVITIGVCVEAVAIGGAAQVYYGDVKVRAGAAVTRGDRLMAETGTGRAIPWATDTSFSCGVALESAVDGQIFRAFIQPSFNATA